MKTLFTMLSFFLLFSSIVLAGDNRNNLGAMDNPRDFGHIVGNGMDWDYALIFELKDKHEAYRAIADIEDKISLSGDQLVGLGFYRGIGVVSIKSSTDRKGLFSKYARASDLTRLCDVNNFKWTYTDEWDALVDGTANMRRLCR